MFPISLGLCVAPPVGPKTKGFRAAGFNLGPERFYFFKLLKFRYGKLSVFDSLGECLG